MAITVVTDPACPRSQAAEPASRRILFQFGDEVANTYVRCVWERAVKGVLQRLLGSG